MYAAELARISGTWNHVTHEKPTFLVGWLDASHEYAKGCFPSDVIPALVRLLGKQKNVMRGFHYCDLCADQEAAVAALQFSYEGVAYTLGHAELHVESSDGSVRYVAPTLIVHYILQHGYLPPAEYLNAVRCSSR